MDIGRSFTGFEIRNKRAQLYVVTSLALLPACGAAGGAEEHAPPRESPEGKLAATSQALHEETCWTHATPHVILHTYGQPGPWTASSPDASYTRHNCQSQWIVEVDETINKALAPTGTASNLFSAPADYCPGYWARNRTKGWKDNAWHDIHTWSLVGGWYCLAGTCGCGQYPVEGTSMPSIVPSTHGYTKVRTVTQAGFAYWLTPARAGVVFVRE
jgi:hypothetical protein